MKPFHRLARLALATALLGSLAACTIVPAYPYVYGGPSVYVETYPVYRSGYPHNHYRYGRHDHRHGNHHDDRRH